jgi:hypothetical protein
MSIFDATAYVIGETAAYVLGLVAGRTFNLEPKRAQRIGEYIVIGAIVGGAVIVTVIYS